MRETSRGLPPAALAQQGSLSGHLKRAVPAWGSRGRRFESARPDEQKALSQGPFLRSSDSKWGCLLCEKLTKS